MDVNATSAIKQAKLYVEARNLWCVIKYEECAGHWSPRVYSRSVISSRLQLITFHQISRASASSLSSVSAGEIGMSLVQLLDLGNMLSGISVELFDGSKVSSVQLEDACIFAAGIDDDRKRFGAE